MRCCICGEMVDSNGVCWSCKIREHCGFYKDEDIQYGNIQYGKEKENDERKRVL